MSATAGRGAARNPSSNKRLAPAVLLLAVICLFVGGSLYQRGRENRAIAKRQKIRQIRVEVLNGTPKEGLAQTVTDRLCRAGFDVVNIANAENDSFPETVVVDRAANSRENAILVAEVLHCENILPQLEPTSLLEVTVIIGNDYLKEKKKRFLGLRY
ncbi:MAG: LytR C-terminal domain-containing protein [Candidatus Edwardsbacteria bacterium]|nr:LytR C-terminal domain-containing protein [Candidatus Edwardsbacteria bacterium]